MFGTRNAGLGKRRSTNMARMKRLSLITVGTVFLLCGASRFEVAASQRQPALSRADVDAIARLVMLEDTRNFDEATLARLLKSSHPEVRRRAVITVGRIVSPGGAALLASLREDPDPAIVAAVAFAAGQMKDAGSVSWLSQLLASPQTPPAVAREAACALGKIRTPEARTALASYLAAAPTTPGAAPVVGEVLLAIGRFTTREDLAPILRWVGARDLEVRWRATWALFRPRDPASVPHLLKLADDASPEVRFWAVRGLAPAQVIAAGLDLAVTSARLRKALGDPDRRVRTEALRALVQYEDDASLKAALDSLESPDTWLSISAAEGLAHFKDRAAIVVPRLVAASAPGKPLALRITVLAPLTALAPEAAADLASALVREQSIVARTAAVQALGRLGETGRARLDALAADPPTKDLVPQAGRGGAAQAGRGGAAQPAGRGEASQQAARGNPAQPAGGGRGAPQQRPARPEMEYRQLVERLVVPDSNGAPKPRAVLGTPRGDIEVELYPGDAPLGVEYFVKMVESGAIVGTEFGRVVPDFVAQQRAIAGAVTLRDEVSQRGLTRGNVSWASSGLDTGRPGYTFGVTPQPHNEGDFTALGRVTRGMDVVERLELGDRITAARMLGPR